MPRVTLGGHIIVPAENLEAVLRELPSHIEQTRKELGCIIFEMTQDRGDPTIFKVYEEFVDRSSFECHQERVQGSTWGRVTANLRRHYEFAEASGDIEQSHAIRRRKHGGTPSAAYWGRLVQALRGSGVILRRMTFCTLFQC